MQNRQQAEEAGQGQVLQWSVYSVESSVESSEPYQTVHCMGFVVDRAVKAEGLG
jgi:hypothetical protein